MAEAGTAALAGHSPRVDAPPLRGRARRVADAGDGPAGTEKAIRRRCEPPSVADGDGRIHNIGMTFLNRRRSGGGPAGAPFVTICHRASTADPEARRGPRLHGPPVVVHLHRPNASAHYRGPTPDGGVPSWCVLVHRLRHKHRRPQPPGEPSWTRSCVRRGSPSFCGRRKPNWMG